ncbi:Wd domain-containing protein, partial [Globisporangium splendens]
MGQVTTRESLSMGSARSSVSASPGTARRSFSRRSSSSSAAKTPAPSSKAAKNSNNSNDGEINHMSTDQQVENALQRMGARPPLHCIFYYETQVKSGQIQMPLLYEKTENQKGTRLMDLELWLRDQFDIPAGSSIFAVVPAEELYSPPYPLVMINTVAGRLYARFENERVPVLQFALVVREMSLLKQPILRGDAQESPYFPISAIALGRKTDSIERKFARMRFVQNMKNWGFARIEVTPEQAQIPADAFKAVRAWLVEQLALPPDQRWCDFVDVNQQENKNNESAKQDGDEPTIDALHATHPMVSKGRYVGFSSDRNREYLQLRRPVAASGTVWPPAYFVDRKDFAMQLLTLLDLLDDIARDCMRAVCEILNIDEKWVLEELLDDRTPPPASEEEVTTRDPSYQYGPSVLRIYNYRNKAAGELPLHPDDHSCGVHADLGLVTVSPVATVPGLQMWNLERMAWSDVEEDAKPIHFSVFAGETLGLVTNGLIKAPLHRVPAICVDSEENRRMSMPYFLRVRPEKCLNPRAEPAAQLTCRDFMEDMVFKKRPWRRDENKKNLPPPDY